MMVSIHENIFTYRLKHIHLFYQSKLQKDRGGNRKILGCKSSSFASSRTSWLAISDISSRSLELSYTGETLKGSTNVKVDQQCSLLDKVRWPPMSSTCTCTNNIYCLWEYLPKASPWGTLHQWWYNQYLPISNIIKKHA